MEDLIERVAQFNNNEQYNEEEARMLIRSLYNSWMKELEKCTQLRLEIEELEDEIQTLTL